MSPISNELGIDTLPVETQLEIAEEIWRNVADGPASSLPTPAQVTELERRLAESEARPNAISPWKVIKARAQARARR